MPGTPRSRSGNLPVEPSTFVGRRHEVDAARRMLTRSRLVTLIGPAGVGKTRLGLRVAEAARPAFRDGVWFVDLTQLDRNGRYAEDDLHDPDVLASLIAMALGLPERTGGPALHALATQLTRRRMLLVLDNCEHLVEACARLVTGLLPACPRLRVLATSREVLAVNGETICPVPPLPVPDAGAAAARPRPAGYDSVALFLERARAAKVGFTLTAENEAVVAELCRRVDGLPLAIELAAARVPVLSPREILDRMVDRFGILDRGAATAAPRQRTLRACVSWSFDLCTKPERLLWARLSVFVGGFELDAVEAVCADDELPEEQVLDLLSSLVDKSIIVREDRPAPARYRMLETIRDFGQEHLADLGEYDSMRRRHRDWCGWLVAQAHAEWTGRHQGSWFARLTHEHANVRAALEYCLAQPDEAEAALVLASGVPRAYWTVRGLLREGRRWLDHALARPTPSSPVRARALLIDSYLAMFAGDRGAARGLLAEGHALAQRLNDPLELARAAFCQGTLAVYDGQLPAALTALEDGLALLAAAPDVDLELRLSLLVTLGAAAGLAGDQERAAACHHEIVVLADRASDDFHRSYALWALGLAEWRAGRPGPAREQVAESLRIKRERAAYDLFGTVLCLEVLAWIEADQGRYPRAATLLGAAKARWTELGTPIATQHQLVGHHAECVRRVRSALGPAAYAQALFGGEALTVAEAAAYALPAAEALAR